MPTYQVNMLPREDSKDQAEDPLKSGAHSVELTFHAPRPVFSVTTEYLVYDLASLAGDVGGMGGMMLGVSAVMVYDGVANFISGMVAKILRKKGKNFKA